jgi:hypothetical protein
VRGGDHHQSVVAVVDHDADRVVVVFVDGVVAPVQRD